MQKYQDVVLNQNGNPVSGVQVTVTDLLGTPVSVYSANAIGLNVNPLTSDNNGRFSFYAPDGRYNLSFSFGGNVVASITDILLEDPMDGSDAVFNDLTILGELSDASKVTSAPVGGLTATNVQAALAELDSEKIDASSLAAPGGSALVGADDGASGSLWTTVAGFISVLLSSLGASVIGFIQAGTGAIQRSVHDKLREFVSVKDFGAVGDGVTDDTAALQAAIDSLKPLRIPAGVYLFSVLNGLDRIGITIVGDGSANTVLKFIGTGDALVLGTTADFRQGINISGFTVEGNANTDTIIKARAIARSQWSDINVREAKSASGIGFLFQGCMLNKFDFLVCSTDRQAMTSPPNEGLRLEALSPFGNCSNNTFTNPYMEGAGRVASTIEFGIRISGGDQNTFVGGAPESCGTWGLLIGAGCRYNTFIGVGMENLNATGGDCGDGGISSRFINCYASQKFMLEGRSASVEGGYFERIQINSGAERNRIKDVLVNGWSTGAGGFYDSGAGTEARDIYDADLGAFITDRFPRFLMYRPSTLSNVTGAGATHTMTWAALYDDGGNCDGTYFAAPVKGRYQLQATLSLDGISTAATLVGLSIVTSNRTYLTQKSINPKAGGTQESITLSVIADMDAADSAYVTVQVSGMAANDVDVIGNEPTFWSTFSGFKV